MTDIKPASSRSQTASPAADDVRPIGALPPSGPTLALVVLAFVILALGLFFLLEGRRVRLMHPRSSEAANEGPPLPSAPPLKIPPPPSLPQPAPQIVAAAEPPLPIIKYIDRPASAAPATQYLPQPPPLPPPPQSAPSQELGVATLVVDLGETPPVGQTPSAEDTAAHALILHHRAALVPQGTLIPAVLETPIDSSRAGLVRALTSADIRGFDGSRVLIPKGSRLVGDFKADLQQGQTRVLVTWNRLVRPDGVAIKLTSPATDVLGGTGIAGDVNNHFLQRFASVALQTAVTVGTDLADQSPNASVVVGVPGQTVGNVGQTLFPTTDLKPTIRVKEGASITVFVARDLDFSGAMPRS